MNKEKLLIDLAIINDRIKQLEKQKENNDNLLINTNLINLYNKRNILIEKIWSLGE